MQTTSQEETRYQEVPVGGGGGGGVGSHFPVQFY